MHSCFHSVSLPNRPLLELLELVKAAGYKAIEINAETLPWAKPHITPAASLSERAAVRDASAKLGLPMVALGAHVQMVGAKFTEREAALTFVLGCLDLAVDLGIPYVHILSGVVPDGIDSQTAWTWFVDAIEKAAHHAADKGIELGVEAIAGHLFHGANDFHRLWLERPDLAVRVNFDPSQLIVQGEDPMRVVNEFGHRIRHVHMKDGAGLFPEFTFPPLGDGSINFPSLIEGLKQQGFDGAMSVEYEAQVYGFDCTEEEILDGGKAFLTGLRIQ